MIYLLVMETLNSVLLYMLYTDSTFILMESKTMLKLNKAFLRWDVIVW